MMLGLNPGVSDAVTTGLIDYISPINYLFMTLAYRSACAWVLLLLEKMESTSQEILIIIKVIFFVGFVYFCCNKKSQI
jgi:hypothetical protein